MESPGPVPPEAANYRQLDEAKIVATIVRLRDRIRERFPESGLARVATELLAIAHESSESIAYIRRPNWGLRVFAVAAIVAMIVTLIVGVRIVPISGQVNGLSDTVQAIEAGINDIIFLAIAAYFLMTIEGRLKRRKALAALHQLRTVVHIVDMHQLTKDPERLLAQRENTPSSPVRTMSAPQLGRYLDYCSEMLSLTSKLSALYVQDLNDPVVLATVSEIESLAASLSNKTWQKITLLEPIAARSIAGAPTAQS